MNRTLFTVFVSFVVAIPLFGDYPLIRYTVESRDPLYSQQQQDVESWYTENEERPSLAIFRYVPRASEDLFSVAAAFNLPYEAVATLNGWDAPGLFASGSELLVPNLPGIFVTATPRNAWERTLNESRAEQDSTDLLVTGPDGVNRPIRFFPGSKFNSDERIRFLGSLFSAPLRGGRITSGYGYRPNPFSGRASFHPGIDIQTAIGSPVFAARDGIVTDTGTLEIYGYFVIINHDGNYQTVYAHLKEILVTRGQEVKAGDQIALSGNSGISTGPHLHFEIRRDGSPIDPARLTALRN